MTVGDNALLVRSAGSKCVGHYKVLLRTRRPPLCGAGGDLCLNFADILEGQKEKRKKQKQKGCKCNVLVGEAVSDGEELLGREAVVGHVACSAAD